MILRRIQALAFPLLTCPPFLRFALLPTVLGSAVLLVGCTRQPEGSRCSTLNGNNDCQGSLVCTSASDLRNGEDGVDRCCPASGSLASSESCLSYIGGGTGGGSGLGGQGGADASGGSSNDGNSGDQCDYNSDCTEPLVCGPQGTCQVECQTDRDCSNGKKCVGDTGAQRCQ
ncbi:MAG: hypothetical protein MK135_17595 [Polyangiaceae bacterium]|nr:hypothetical protein [Polyangiaceae bacterium]